MLINQFASAAAVHPDNVPLLEYKFPMVVDKPTGRELLDYGKGHSNGKLYFGRGLKLNGVDQSFTVNTQEATHLYYFFNGELQELDVASMDSKEFTAEGVYQNAISTSIQFTSEQIEYLKSHPEKFLYSVATTQTDGSKTYSLHSEILTQDEIDSVVAYLPMCETDDYVRDMVGYSEGVDLIQFPLANWTISNDSGDSSITEDENGNIVIDYIATDDVYLNMQQSVSVTDVPLKVQIVVESLTGSIKIQDSDTDGSFGRIYEAGTYEFVSTSNQPNIIIARNSNVDDTHAVISSFKLVELTSTHQITNFTNSCRDEALHLTYGLQTCFLQRDELGVPSGSSFDRLQVNAEKCPLYFSLTDAELHEANNGNWQIEMVLNREYVNDITDKTFDSIAIDSDGNLTGLLLMFNKSWDSRYCTMYFYKNDSNTFSYQSFKIIKYGDNVSLHLVFQHYDDNTHELFLNGDSVSGKKTSGFVPSGNSLVNLYQNIFNGELRLLRFHTTPQNPVELYNEAVRKGLLDA